MRTIGQMIGDCLSFLTCYHLSGVFIHSLMDLTAPAHAVEARPHLSIATLANKEDECVQI